MASPSIEAKTTQLKLRFEKMNGLAAAQEMLDAPKEYLAFDRGILWRAVVLNPGCEAGAIKFGFVLAGDLTGVVASSVAETRERDRKALEKSLAETEEARRKWQSRAQKNLDEYASYKAYVKTEYGPRISALEKGKGIPTASAEKPKEGSSSQKPKPHAYGIGALNRLEAEMVKYYEENPEKKPEGMGESFSSLPIQRYLRRAITENETAAWYMTMLMDDMWTGPDDYGKVVSSWMDFFESAKEGAVHGAAKRVFSTLQQLKNYAREGKNLLANYPKKAFTAMKAFASKTKEKAQASYGKARDAAKVRFAKVSLPKEGFLKRMKARFISGGKGVRRLWKNVWEGDTSKKGLIMRVVASATLLPFVSIAAFAASFIANPSEDEEDKEEKQPKPPASYVSIVDPDDEERREPQSSYFRAAAVSNIRDSVSVKSAEEGSSYAD
jgi:hypothetical protein